ncbi:MAG: zinc-binding alcohol dehydrogenase family protein [Ruminococcaceae bacterium]|nr:zinc-binding alcohol dehydrogenase family protein [Oscillospiraceae bacterium]
MKSVYLAAPKQVSAKDIPAPTKVNADEVMVRIHAASICGSDIGAYRGTNALVSYPRILGHELAGEIMEAGADSGFAVGERVAIEPYINCGTCYPCSLGRTNCCENLKVLGVQTDGGMVEQFVHPARLVHRMPADMSWEDAALIEPLTIALHSAHRAGVQAGEHVVVCGAGPIGLLAGSVVLAYGATPILIDPINERLELAHDFGVEFTINPVETDAVARIKEITNGRMAEAVIEASGASSSVAATVDYVAYAGRIALTGWPKEKIAMDTGMFTKKELDIRGSRTSAGEFPEAIELIQSGKIPVQKLISLNTRSLEGLAPAVEEMSAHPEKFIKIIATF